MAEGSECRDREERRVERLQEAAPLGPVGARRTSAFSQTETRSSSRTLSTEDVIWLLC